MSKSVIVRKRLIRTYKTKTLIANQASLNVARRLH